MALQKDPPEVAPEVWRPARLLVERAIRPVERFLEIEASSGIALLAVAAIALAWANSPWAESYFALWHLPVGIRLGGFAFERDLHFWVNDGLMTIFFFVVGLEIRREIHGGELSELRRAALPLAAALGGMLLPAAIYLALNAGRDSVRGWGVPMATDIAFAVGVLALLGKRVPSALRILLLALAVIDDVGAILVIALFYSKGFALAGFGLLAAGIVAILAMQAFGVRSVWAYVPAGALVWSGAYSAGVHPTLAGVIVGLMTPVRVWIRPAQFIDRASELIHALREQTGKSAHHLEHHLKALDLARRESIAPVERLQHALHRWVAFGIMPLFALANAGVPVGNLSMQGDAPWVMAGVIGGLLLGKPLGILGLSYLSATLKLAVLPRGVSWAQVGLVGSVGGIGFTMALFVSQLAFPQGAILEAAKLSILIGSALAAGLGFALGKIVLPRTGVAEAAATPSEAEASTEA